MASGNEKITVDLPAGALATLHNLTAERVLGETREEIARYLLIGALLDRRRQSGKKEWTDGQ